MISRERGGGGGGERGVNAKAAKSLVGVLNKN